MREARIPAEPRQDPSSYLPLKPDVFLILSILAQEARHGYGIMAAAEAWPGGGMEIQAGALYRRLKWMREEGLIEELEEDEVSGADRERRRYYGVTPFGRRVATAEAKRMGDLLVAAREANLLLGSSGPGRP
jgi:DNA-binding PadR family transcriptional regulator